MGKGKSETPQAPKIPTFGEQLDQYISRIPDLQGAQLQALQQYGLPMAQEQQGIQEAMLPGITGSKKDFLDTFRQDLTGQLSPEEESMFLDTIRANLGTNVGSPIGAVKTGRDMFQMGQAKKQSAINPLLSMFGMSPTPQAMDTTYMNMSPGQAMSAQQGITNQQLSLFGTQSQLAQNQSDPLGTILGTLGGQALGAFGGVGGAMGAMNLFGGGSQPKSTGTWNQGFLDNYFSTI